MKTHTMMMSTIHRSIPRPFKWLSIPFILLCMAAVIVYMGTRVGAQETVQGGMTGEMDASGQSLVIDRTMGGVAPQVQNQLLLALVYIGSGQYSTALEYYHQALQESQKSGDAAGEVKALMNMAVVYHTLGEDADALKYLTQAVKTTQQIGDQSGKTRALAYINVVYKELGRYVAALSGIPAQ
jgi:tetratricopeptide (TPR) repeat protein